MNSSGNNQVLASEVRRLVILWGACCVSPIMYLAAAAILQETLMNGGGFLPMSGEIWKNTLIGLGVWAVVMQTLHLLVKRRYKAQLAELAADTGGYMRLLTRRTMILISLSELTVFAGFCLFILQGDLLPVFGGGVAAMLLYAQSHPRSAAPVN